MIQYAVVLFFDAINGMYGRVRRGTSKAFPDAAPGRTVPLTNIRFLIKIAPENIAGAIFMIFICLKNGFILRL